jgi:hypothetical protein
MNAQENQPDRLRVGAYVVIAVVAFLVGVIFGELGVPSPGGSRVGWPPPPTNPRALSP